MGPFLLQLLTAVKGLGGSLQHLQCEGSNDVGLASDGLSSLHSLRSEGGDHLSTIDQSQTLQGGYKAGGSYVNLITFQRPPATSAPHLL